MNKYTRIVKNTPIDVYDILQAWEVKNPALQHLIKKALQPGDRGHKTREEDMRDIVRSAIRAVELEFPEGACGVHQTRNSNASKNTG